MAPTAGASGPPRGRFPSEVASAAHVVLDVDAGSGPPNSHGSVSPPGCLADQLTLGGDIGHHLGRVLRLRVGEVVTVADGAGVWRSYQISQVAGGAVTLDADVDAEGDAEGDADAEVEPLLEPLLTVAFCLTKRDKPDLVVQKLTELGIDRIVPVQSDRSVVRWDERQATAALARLGRIAREACGQCRRARVPHIAELVTLTDLLAMPGVVVADRSGPSALDLALDTVVLDTGATTAGAGPVVLIGPEGGFSAAENVLVRDLPRVSVGVHVLRAETAAVAVAACLTAHRARYYNSA
jgi:16S rRNA (uracil1498-N3)-methyltransferase